MNDRLHQLAWQFNVAPSAYCHPDWLAPGLSRTELGPATIDRRHRYLSPWLLAEHDLTEVFHFDFQHPMSRVALFDTPVVQKIAGILGLLRHRDAVRRTVDRSTLADLARATGPDDVKLVRDSHAELALSMDTNADWSGTPGKTCDTLWSEGLSLLFALMPVASAAINKRLILKFPRGISEQTPGIKVLTKADRLGIRQWLLEGAIPKVEPQWASLLS